jgi:hypothetical protein
LSEINKLKIGIKYKGLLIAALAFADDLCILTESLEDMQTILSALERVSGKIGLKFNPKKTEVLRTGSLVNKSNSGLRLYGEEIRLSVDFKYLGATVDKEGKRSMSKERIKMMGNFNHTRAFFGMNRMNWRLENQVCRVMLFPGIQYTLEVTKVNDREHKMKDDAMARIGKSMMSAIKGTSHLGVIGEFGWRSTKSIAQQRTICNVERTLRK